VGVNTGGLCGLCGGPAARGDRYLHLSGPNPFRVVELSVEMIERRPTPSPNGGHAARCLLLVPRGHDAPLDLIDGLNRRKVATRQVHDAPAVMVALAEQTRRRPKVVVIVHPQAQTCAAPLVRAIRKYHGDVAIWQYDFAGDPRLHAWPDEPKPEPSVEISPPAAEPIEQPAEQATQSPEPDETPALDEPLDEIDPPLLTDEELAMLLGDDDADFSEKDATR